MDYEPNRTIWQSYVYHKDKCFFVSTIERTYDVYGGITRGLETLVWDYNDETRERGDLVYQAGGAADHQTICRCIIAEGELPDEENPKHARFFK
jgi:hypothetical protein